jgi:hypothetical protein
MMVSCLWAPFHDFQPFAFRERLAPRGAFAAVLSFAWNATPLRSEKVNGCPREASMAWRDNGTDDWAFLGVPLQVIRPYEQASSESIAS